MMESTSGKRVLAPFQAEFVRQFLGEYRRGAVYLLIGPVGIGKSFALAEAVARLASERTAERVLLLCPAPLVDQWVHRLKQHGTRANSLTPEAYRLLREEVGSDAALPAGIFVISIDFAKRPDVRTQLQYTIWDLIVVDEAHILSGQRERLIDDLRSTGRSALLLATATPTQTARTFGAVAVRFDWYGHVAEQLAAATAAGPAAVRTLLATFTRSAEERAVLAQVTKLAARLEPLVGQALLRRAGSSLNALELLLIRWIGAAEMPAEYIEACRSIVADLEQIATDAQLQCAVDIVQDQAPAHGHVVVFTDYMDTARYILGTVADVTNRAVLIHGGLAQEEQLRAYDVFRADGGVLITTSAAGASTSLGFVNTVIHYDLPRNVHAFAQREGRYRRLGRTVTCTAHILTDEADLLGTRRLADEFLTSSHLLAPPELSDSSEDDVDF